MSKHVRGVKPALSPDHEALTEAPKAPARFDKYARAEWKRIMPQLIARRIITEADLAGIENYCLAIGEVNRIAAYQKTLKLPDLKFSGLQIRHMQTARQLAAEYGLTPTSRARVGAGDAAVKKGGSMLSIGRS